MSALKGPSSPGAGSHPGLQGPPRVRTLLRYALRAALLRHDRDFAEGLPVRNRRQTQGAGRGGGRALKRGVVCSHRRRRPGGSPAPPGYANRPASASIACRTGLTFRVIELESTHPQPQKMAKSIKQVDGPAPPPLAVSACEAPLPLQALCDPRRLRAECRVMRCGQPGPWLAHGPMARTAVGSLCGQPASRRAVRPCRDQRPPPHSVHPQPQPLPPRAPTVLPTAPPGREGRCGRRSTRRRLRCVLAEPRPLWLPLAAPAALAM